MEPHEREPWPVGRSRHAACCLGHGGDHIHLLVTGGIDDNIKTLNDIWLFNLSLKKWKEVLLWCNYYMSCTLHIVRAQGTGADPGFPIGGFYLFKCPRTAREKFEAMPTLSKPHPFSCVFASSQSQFTAATDLWISNLAKVSESTFKHDSTS